MTNPSSNGTGPANATASMTHGVPAAYWESHGYYPYVPSTTAATIFAVFYGFAFFATLIQYVRLRTWYFWTMVFGALMSAVGFVARVPSAYSPTEKPLYVIQFCLIILAPAVLCAGIYQSFGRLIYWTTPPAYQGFKSLWLPARFITPIFVTCDVISFTIQLVGAGMVASSEPTETDKLDKGTRIVKIGLAVQLIGFGFFTISGLRFVFAAGGWARKDAKGWKILAWTINAGCAAILVRSGYRMGEFVGGRTGELHSHEAWFLGFDAAVMLGVLALFCIIHPGMFLPAERTRIRKFKEVKKVSEDEGELGVEMDKPTTAGAESGRCDTEAGFETVVKPTSTV